MYNLRNNIKPANQSNPAGRWTAEEQKLFEEAY